MIFIKLELGSHASKRLKDASLLIHYVSVKTAGYFAQFRRYIHTYIHKLYLFSNLRVAKIES